MNPGHYIGLLHSSGTRQEIASFKSDWAWKTRKLGCSWYFWESVRNKPGLWLELYYSEVCWFSLVDFLDYFGNLMSTGTQLFLSRLKHHYSALIGTNSWLRVSGYLDQKHRLTFTLTRVKWSFYFPSSCNIYWAPTPMRDTSNTKIMKHGMFPQRAQSNQLSKHKMHKTQ